MISEIDEAKQYLHKKFSNYPCIPNGNYAVPVRTSKGEAFMMIIVKEYDMSGFHLFWDEDLKYSWYDMKKPCFKMFLKNCKDWINSLEEEIYK